MYIETNDELKLANQILHESQDLLSEFVHVCGAQIELKGIGQFNGNTVIYSGLPDSAVSTSKFHDLVCTHHHTRHYHRKPILTQL